MPVQYLMPAFRTLVFIASFLFGLAWLIHRDWGWLAMSATVLAFGIGLERLVVLLTDIRDALRGQPQQRPPRR